LLFITTLVVLALNAAQARVDEIQENRVQAVKSVCAGQNKVAHGVNQAFAYIQNLITSGAVLPGDEVVAKDTQGTKDPVDDIPTKIKPGPLSRQLQAQFGGTGYPTVKERVARAREQAIGLQKLQVPNENCKAAVARVQEEQGG